ncbi:MAG: HlyD family efflux transporter periplasmic adaptor subunit [Gemmataceae bacterium]|nr:HlyD family efflux transporter periplasmic adaptor subunit [Gemmataceae bacterium]
MNRLPWIFGLLLLVGTLAGGAWAYNQSHPKSHSSGPEPKSEPPAGVICIGFVDGDPGIANLYPVQTGRVMEVVPEGMTVRKGDAILKLDPRFAEQKVQEATADLEASKEQLERAKFGPKILESKKTQQRAALEAAKIQRRKAQFDLQSKIDQAKQAQINLNENLVNALQEAVKQIDRQIDAEQAKLEELDLVRPDIDTLRAAADVAAKQARLTQAELGLKECSLLAPSDGLVLRVQVGPGEVLGQNPKNPPVQFLPEGKRVIRGEVLQEWASRVAVGQKAVIEDDTYQGPQWQGKVVRLSEWFAPRRNPIVEPFMVNDVRTIEAMIEVTSTTDYPLRVGQRVRIRILTEK